MNAVILRLSAHLFATTAAVAPVGLSAAEEPADPDMALKPAHVIVNPWRFHIPPPIRQGVPGIELTAKGRLWAVYDLLEAMEVDRENPLNGGIRAGLNAWIRPPAAGMCF